MRKEKAWELTTCLLISTCLSVEHLVFTGGIPRPPCVSFLHLHSELVSLRYQVSPSQMKKWSPRVYVADGLTDGKWQNQGSLPTWAVWPHILDHFIPGRSCALHLNHYY